MSRIMFLGAGLMQIPAIVYAKEQGHYVITVDYLPSNPGHRYGDEYVNLSIAERDAVLVGMLAAWLHRFLTSGGRLRRACRSLDAAPLAIGLAPAAASPQPHPSDLGLELGAVAGGLGAIPVGELRRLPHGLLRSVLRAGGK